MKNRKKQDKVFVNLITSPNDIKSISDKPISNTEESPSCLYAGVRHAVGSKIKNRDGSEIICTEDGSWQNS